MQVRVFIIPNYENKTSLRLIIWVSDTLLLSTFYLILFYYRYLEFLSHFAIFANLSYIINSQHFQEVSDIISGDTLSVIQG
jgi:hypothetical protein